MTYYDPQDFEQNRLVAAAGYLVFFLPLLLRPSSRLCRFAANQGLNGLLGYLVVLAAFWILNLLLGWIPVVGLLIRICGYLCRLAVVAMMIYFGVQCFRGQAKRLPLVGDLNLLH